MIGARRFTTAFLVGLGLSATAPLALADGGALTLYRSFNREFATTPDMRLFETEY